MSIDFQNLKLNISRTRPLGYKYPNGLSFGSNDFFDVATPTLSQSTNFVTAVNESTPAPAPSGPNGLEHTAGTANTSMQWNSSGTFVPTFTGEVEVLVVAGGGGAGVGGGGAGGLTYASNQPVTKDTTYNCLVGAGGIWNPTHVGGPPASPYHPSGNIQGPNAWQRGGYSSNIAEMPITTTGGGGGANQAFTSGDNSTHGWNNGGPGGSSGGGAIGRWYTSSYNNSNGGSGSSVAGQGNPGGSSLFGSAGLWSYGMSGAGGGAGQAGESGNLLNVGAAGGDGLEYSISGSPVYYAGGGGGGGGWLDNSAGAPDCMTSTEGAGGNGGGGDGAYGAIGGVPGGTPGWPYPAPVSNGLATAGAANRGGGGGGGISSQGIGPIPGQNGGSGVIIIRFKTFQRLDDHFFID